MQMGSVLTLPVTRPRVKMRPSRTSMRRGARVVESTCLESMRPSNGTVGSNPTLSAKTIVLSHGS